MKDIPKKVKMTKHAKLRLEERKQLENLYRKRHIIDSPCIWYGIEDFIVDCAYYRHCKYICRKSKDISCMTDGRIEIIFNRNTKAVITILKVKDKFKPITKYLIEHKVEKYNIVQRKEPPQKPLTAKDIFGI